jgi:hypothetical protein
VLRSAWIVALTFLVLVAGAGAFVLVSEVSHRTVSEEFNGNFNRSIVYNMSSDSNGQGTCNYDDSNMKINPFVRSGFISIYHNCTSTTGFRRGTGLQLNMTTFPLNGTYDFVLLTNVSTERFVCDATNLCAFSLFNIILTKNDVIREGGYDPITIFSTEQMGGNYNMTNWSFALVFNTTTHNVSLYINTSTVPYRSVSFDLPGQEHTTVAFHAQTETNVQQQRRAESNTTIWFLEMYLMRTLTVRGSTFSNTLFGLPMNMTQEVISTNANITVALMNFTAMMPNGTIVGLGNGTYVLNDPTTWGRNYWSNWTSPSVVIPNRTSSIGNWTFNLTTRDVEGINPTVNRSVNISIEDQNAPRAVVNSPLVPQSNGSVVTINVSIIENLVHANETFAVSQCWYNLTKLPSVSEINNTPISCLNFFTTVLPADSGFTYELGGFANDTSGNGAFFTQNFTVGSVGGSPAPGGGGGGGGGGGSTTPEGVVCNTATVQWNATTEQNTNRYDLIVAPRDARSRQIKFVNGGPALVALNITCQEITAGACTGVLLERSGLDLAPSTLQTTLVRFTYQSGETSLEEPVFFNLFVTDQTTCAGFLNVKVTVDLLQGLLFKFGKPVSVFDAFSVAIGFLLVPLFFLIAVGGYLGLKLLFGASSVRRTLAASISVSVALITTITTLILV